MTTPPGADDIRRGWDPDPGASRSLHADAYTQQHWFDVDQAEIIGRTWQWLCHGEKLHRPGSFVTDTIAGMPIVALRHPDGDLRAFYNVCKHRAHELIEGEGQVKNLVCPYHAWSYDLDDNSRQQGTPATSSTSTRAPSVSTRCRSPSSPASST